MSSFSTTARADDDLLDIYLFGIERFGRLQAARYLADMHHVFTLLGENPRMGREADRIAPGVRRHEHGAHVIFYEEAGSGALILAIVHKAGVERLEL
ncbi:type II toxin-antitoxin system RelE/ParE family toxin [Bosea caraganae]|uniref:Toxin n=1 Tax=Bosea caraganae TaxID=2763117 RepID=A0A370LAH7_9HYPH|nr:type II toxin-antitoxin system RelE/ParE family toxin [Bosea caraganae]RDJ21663.1 type II toxin-antitoxin system RelE/ParE family toxin [Bosea caraganae]RDJ28307.1 type II toxin-antitoxin system RelE/ParE family toxin [Bosea caraganae]